MKDFYSEYAQQWVNKRKSNKHYGHDYLEKPAIYKLTGDVSGKSVLSLGCGSGEECFYLAENGAKKVRGIDISKGLIELSKYSRPDLQNVQLETGDISRMNFGEDKYDLVFSSLAFHYIENWQELLGNIKKSMKKDGELVFSTNHPVRWGSQSSRGKDQNKFILGYEKNKKDNSFEIWGDYLGFRKVKDKLFGKIDIEFYNRSISSMFLELKKAGFSMEDLVEPTPDKSNINIPIDFAEVYSKIPLFLIIKATIKK